MAVVFEKNLEGSAGLPPAITWVSSNATDIRRIALNYRNIYPASQRNRPELSRQVRLLSEMPLCMSLGTIAQTQRLPEGFLVVLGSVSVYDTTSAALLREPRQHMFFELSDPDKTILCLFPGQYIFPIDPTKPERGQRTEILHERATQNGFPELVHTIPLQEITALYGRAEKIREALGLEYSDVPLQTFY